MEASASVEPLPEPGPREWTRRSAAGPIDRARLDAWRAEAGRRYDEVLGALVSTPSPRELAPGITVVVAAGPDTRGCLARLNRQTLDPSLIEVVLVGPEIDAVQEDTGRLDVRTIVTGAGPLRIGATAASRAYLAVIDDSARIAGTYLAALFACANTGAVVTASPAGTARAQGWCAPTEYVRDALSRLPGPAGPDDDVLLRASLRIHYGLNVVACPAVDQTVGDPKPPAPSFTNDVVRPLETIAAVQSMAAPGTTADAVREMVGEQADIIGVYLAARPEARPDVVRALDRSPARDLPYERINSTAASALAIAYAFPPYADTSAIVAAKRLRASGEVYDVISNAMDAIRDVDPDTARIAGPFVARARAVRTPSYFTAWGPMEAFAVKGSSVIREWLAGREPYRVVYSRAHFAASHVLAAAYKLAEPSAVWQAEFSDPLSRSVAGAERGARVNDSAFARKLRSGVAAAGLPTPSSDNAFVWCEELAYALADELIFTNENQLEYMLGYCPDQRLAAIARSKAVVRPQPVLPAEFYAMTDAGHAVDTDRVNIGYFGSFYVNRGVDDVLCGLKDLDERTRRRVMLHVFTDHVEKIRSRVEDLGVSGNVRLNHYLPYLAFLRATAVFDCLVVADADTSGSHTANPYLPSKWADYAGSGVAVWGLVAPDSPLSRQDLAYASPLGDRQAAQAVIRRIVANRGNSLNS